MDTLNISLGVVVTLVIVALLFDFLIDNRFTHHFTPNYSSNRVTPIALSPIPLMPILISGICHRHHPSNNRGLIHHKLGMVKRIILALTQILVEVVTLIAFVLVLRRFGRG